MPATTPKTLSEILQLQSHVIYHETSFEAALAILREGSLHGLLYGGNKDCLEPWPHFMYEGWPNAQCAAARQIRLIFRVPLPARLHPAHSGAPLPVPGALEVYTDDAGRIDVVSLHPDNPPLTLIATEPSLQDLRRGLRPDWLSWREGAENRLRRHLAQALAPLETAPIMIRPGVEWDHIVKG